MEGERVLLDTSIWIEYFGNPSGELASSVDRYLADEVVFVPLVVLAELIQGAKSERELSAIGELSHTVHLLKEQEDTWRQAGRLSYELKRKGFVVNLIDCYIARIALENDCKVFTKDIHFELVTKIAPLRLMQ